MNIKATFTFFLFSVALTSCTIVKNPYWETQHVTAYSVVDDQLFSYRLEQNFWFITESLVERQVADHRVGFPIIEVSRENPRVHTYYAITSQGNYLFTHDAAKRTIRVYREGTRQEQEYHRLRHGAARKQMKGMLTIPSVRPTKNLGFK